MWWLPKALEPLNIDLSNFDWAGLDEKEKYYMQAAEQDGLQFCTLKQELFDMRIYDMFYQVKEGDVVFDIGANVGAYTYSILNRNPKRVYCFEPSTKLMDALWRNTRSDKIVYINRAISNYDSDGISEDESAQDVWEHHGEFKTISFSTALQKYELTHIDLIKTDCEGGEYSIFTESNKDFLLNNVDYIAGEFHLTTTLIEKFKKFRDLYLKEHKSFHVTARNYPDVSTWIFDDEYLHWYLRRDEKAGAQFMIYIDNVKNRAAL